MSWSSAFGRQESAQGIVPLPQAACRGEICKVPGPGAPKLTGAETLQPAVAPLALFANPKACICGHRVVTSLSKLAFQFKFTFNVTRILMCFHPRETSHCPLSLPLSTDSGSKPELQMTTCKPSSALPNL